MMATLSFMSSETRADGSWGSSRGGFGAFGGGLVSGGSYGGGASGGSWGCRGGLFSNAPVRSLLARLGGGVADILERQPVRTALFGGCWGGGSGGFGCGGSRGFGCGGGYVSSCVGSSAPTWGGGCVGGIAASPVTSLPSLAAPMWDMGSTVAASDLGIGIVQSVPAFDNSANSVSAYQSPSSAIAISQYETSAPVLDYGYTGSEVGIVGVPTDASMINGNVVTGPMLEVSPGTTTYPTPAPGLDMTPGLDSPPSSIQGGGDEDIGAIEDDDSASLDRSRRSGTAILTIDVPENSAVYVNDRLTNTKGTRRSYASRNLQPGEEYRYRVRVESEIDGQKVVKNDTIVMKPNDRELLAFDFQPVVTRVVVKVPQDAKVTIDGSDTDATGTYRSFSTRKLKSGKWDDYSVEVSVVREGKTLTQRREFDLVAGQFRFLPFDFDTASDVATK